MEKFYLYILKCRDESYYVGHTDNIIKRISEYKAGKIACYTKKRLPVEAVHVNYFTSRDEALVAERKIKGWSRKKRSSYK